MNSIKNAACLLILTIYPHIASNKVHEWRKESVAIKPNIIWDEVDYSSDLNMNMYKQVLGHRESLNNYHIVNKYGYMGRWQFSLATLRSLGFNVSRNKFIQTPSIQHKAIEALVVNNLEVIRRQGLLKYCGSNINGVEITLMGLLASCHLVGPRATKMFVLTGGKYDKVDGMGTKASHYIQLFSTPNIIRYKTNAIQQLTNGTETTT